MDGIFTMQKVQAIKKSRSMKKQHQHLLDNLFFYSFAAITCSLLCSVPFWLPTLFSSVKFLLVVALPKITPALLNAKALFIVSNLIVIVLVGESKFFASKTPPPANDFYYEEYVKRSCANRSQVEKLPEGNVEKTNLEFTKKEPKDSLEREDEISVLPTEELNKRADDFIARVNRRRRIEAKMFLCASDN